MICHNVVNGTEIEMDILRYDYRQHPRLVNCEDLTDALVNYDHKSESVTVDVRASDEYALWATTHEMICCGPYKYLAPKTDRECCRCGAIDLMLLDVMPEESRREYRAKRLEMFKTLIKENLNEPMNESFKHAIEALSV